MVFISTVDGTGQDVRKEVDNLADLVKIKYGEPSKKVPFNKSAIDKGMPSWMTRLAKDSVMYGYGWRTGDTVVPMPEGLYTVEVKAGASTETEGYAIIRYTYDNFDACQREFKERKAVDL